MMMLMPITVMLMRMPLGNGDADNNDNVDANINNNINSDVDNDFDAAADADVDIKNNNNNDSDDDFDAAADADVDSDTKKNNSDAVDNAEYKKYMEKLDLWRKIFKVDTRHFKQKKGYLFNCTMETYCIAGRFSIGTLPVEEIPKIPLTMPSSALLGWEQLGVQGTSIVLDVFMC